MSYHEADAHACAVAVPDSWPWLMPHLFLEQFVSCACAVFVCTLLSIHFCLPNYKDLHVIDELHRTQQSTGVKGPIAVTQFEAASVQM